LEHARLTGTDFRIAHHVLDTRKQHVDVLAIRCTGAARGRPEVDPVFAALAEAQDGVEEAWRLAAGEGEIDGGCGQRQGTEGDVAQCVEAQLALAQQAVPGQRATGRSGFGIHVWRLRPKGDGWNGCGCMCVSSPVASPSPQPLTRE